MSKKTGFPFAGLIALSIVIAGVVGWILNIGAIVHNVSEPITGLFIVRCVGIFVAPLGSVLGFF